VRKAFVTSTRIVLAIVLCILSSGVTLLKPTPAAALPYVSNRFDRMSTSVASANATHVIGFTINNVVTPLGSVEIEFCSNDAIPATPCTAPSGFDILSSTFSNQTGNTGFSVHPNSTANKIILTRFPVLPMGGASTYEFTNVTNPDTAGSHFIRLRTYPSDDATGAATEEGGIAFVINSQVSVSAEVPPYLKFCAGVTIAAYDCSTATSFFIDLGEFSEVTAAAASSEFVLATNAGSGLTVTITGTTLTSGNNTIAEVFPAGVSSPGTSQFGINLRANGNPSIGAEPNGPGTATVRPEYNTPNVFRFVNNEALVSTNTTSDNRKFTVSYMTNISSAQAPGVYATTMSFICLANF
jgi:hypothetical protein